MPPISLNHHPAALPQSNPVKAPRDISNVTSLFGLGFLAYCPYSPVHLFSQPIYHGGYNTCGNFV